MEQMGAALGTGPLGPLVKTVQQGWGSVAELARSPYAAPVVMSLMIVGLKLVGSMTNVDDLVEEADVTEPGSAAEAAGEETDGAVEAAEEEDAIDAVGVEVESEEE